MKSSAEVIEALKKAAEGQKIVVVLLNATTDDCWRFVQEVFASVRYSEATESRNGLTATITFVK